MTCRHCGTRPVGRPRGLCWGCYRTPAVLALYPSTSKYAHRGIGLRGPGRRTPKPTAATPGSPEKVAVLAARSAAGERLWHPDDAVGVREHGPIGHHERAG